MSTYGDNIETAEDMVRALHASAEDSQADVIEAVMLAGGLLVHCAAYDDGLGCTWTTPPGETSGSCGGCGGSFS